MWNKFCLIRQRSTESGCANDREWLERGYLIGHTKKLAEFFKIKGEIQLINEWPGKCFLIGSTKTVF